MKPEDYFKIMDCASEEDITEMMQHRRFRQIPSGEEDTMKQSEQQEKKVFRMTRRGVASGTAVAAALVLLNVGFGKFMLHKAAEQSVSTADSEIYEVTGTASETATAVQAAATTAVTETASNAAEQTSFAQQTTANASTQQTGETPAAVKQASAETPAAKSQQTSASPAKAETPKNSKLTYSLVPADRTYESTETNENAPVVFHAKAGEQIKMQLKVQNDPGVAYFGIQYNMAQFNLLSQTKVKYYNGNVNSIFFGNGQDREDRILTIDGTGNGSTKAPDGAALAEYTLLAPTRPGRYLIQEYVTEPITYVNDLGEEVPVYNVYLDADQTTHVDYEAFGAEIIVEAADKASTYLIDPETMNGPTLYMEPITAHAGQKNVPVNVYVKGCDPFVSGFLRFGYDSALKSKLFDCDTMNDSDQTASCRLGISVDGTLLEHTMHLDSSTLNSSVITVSFNNYREFGYNEAGKPTVFRNGETAADATITDDGILFTMFFDMPEECGQYQIYASEGSLGGGAAEEPDCLPTQKLQNFIPCNITVIP